MRAKCRVDQLHVGLLGRRQAGVMSGRGGERHHGRCCPFDVQSQASSSAAWSKASGRGGERRRRMMSLSSQAPSEAAWSAAWSKAGGRGAGFRRRETPLSLQSSTGTGIRAECRLDWRCHAVLPSRWRAGAMSRLGGERRHCRRGRPPVPAWRAVCRVNSNCACRCMVQGWSHHACQAPR
jgi:hypothetical protein